MADGTVDIDVKVDASDAKSQLDSVEKKASGIGDEASKSGSKTFDGLKGSASSALGVLGTMAGVLGGIGLAQLASDAVSASDAMDKFKNTMSFAGIDDGEISRVSDEMKTYADQTVFSLSDVMNTTAQLAANGVPDYDKLTQAAGNLTAVAGGGADAFSAVAMVLTKTAGAGKLTTENWNQLTDAIPGASGKLQDAMLQNGAYTGNFRDAMEKGEITADEFNQAISDLGMTDAAQDAAASTDTFEGAMGNLAAAGQDAFMQLYDAIGKDNITGAINAISAAVTWVAQNMNVVLPVVGALAAAFIALQVAGMLAGAGVTIATAPLLIVIGVIALVVAAVVALVMNWDTVAAAAQSVWGMVTSAIQSFVDAAVNFFTVTVPAALQSMLAWFSQLPGQIGSFLAGVISAVGGWVAQMASDALSAGQQFLSNAAGAISQLPGQIAGFLGSVIGNVAGWVGEMASNAMSAAQQFGSNLMDGLSSIPGMVGDIGGQIVQGIADGISGAAGHVLDAIGGVVGGALDWAKSLLGIHSPSKVMRREVGRFIPEGVAVGIEDTQDEVVDAVHGMVGLTVDAAQVDPGSIGAGMTTGAQAQGGMTLVIDGATVNSNSAIRSCFYDLIGELEPLGDM